MSDYPYCATVNTVSFIDGRGKRAVLHRVASVSRWADGATITAIVEDESGLDACIDDLIRQLEGAEQ